MTIMTEKEEHLNIAIDEGDFAAVKIQVENNAYISNAMIEKAKKKGYQSIAKYLEGQSKRGTDSEYWEEKSRLSRR